MTKILKNHVAKGLTFIKVENHYQEDYTTVDISNSQNLIMSKTISEICQKKLPELHAGPRL
jgi:hypothetical protein